MIGNVSRDAVGAEKKFGAVVDFNDFHVNFNAIVRAEGPANDIFAGMIGGLFCSHASRAYFFLDHGVVFGFPQELSGRRQPIKRESPTCPIVATFPSI